jgi:hypothetical protein
MHFASIHSLQEKTMIKKLVGATSLVALFAAATHAQHPRSPFSQPRISYRAIENTPEIHVDPLHCAAQKLHEAIVAFQSNAARFAPTDVEVCLANDLVPLACSLVDATECGVPWPQTLCEIRKVQTQLERIEIRLDRYCAAQLHPAFAQQWQCVVRSWTDLLPYVDAPVVVPTIRARVPTTPPWYDLQVSRRGIPTEGIQHPGVHAAPDFSRSTNAVSQSLYDQRTELERLHREDFSNHRTTQPAFPRGGENERYGYRDPRHAGPQPGDVGMALANTILRRLLER